MDRVKHFAVMCSGSLALLAAAASFSVQAEGAAPAPTGAVVSMAFDNTKGMYFTPTELTVKPGTTVTFNNSDGSNHSVVFKDGTASGRMKHHTTWTRTFTTPGSYPFVCSIHGDSMSGTIIVK